MKTLSEKKAYIRDYEFSPSILNRAYSEIESKFSVELGDDIKYAVVEALKDYFICCVSGRGSVGMPSVMADELWHVFLIYTTNYHNFCYEIDQFIHHNPEDIKADEAKNDELKLEKVIDEQILSKLRTFIICCEIEDLNPYETKQMPLLFNLDYCVESDVGHYHSIEKIKEDMIKYELTPNKPKQKRK